MSPFRKRRDADDPSTPPAPARSAPYVDVDTAVENPNLVAAINAFSAAPGPETELQMLHAYNSAVYLAAADFTGATLATDKTGDRVMKAGSRITLRSVELDGAQLLAVFTDWDALRRFAGPDAEGLVLPAADVWALATSSFQGVILNPGSPYLTLNHAQIQLIQAAGTGG